MKETRTMTAYLSLENIGMIGFVLDRIVALIARFVTRGTAAS